MRKIAGSYLIAVSIAVALFFITDTHLVETVDVVTVWHVLDALMLTGLVLGLLFNYANKRAVGNPGTREPVVCGHLEANIAFYATAAITTLFLRNWLIFLARGGARLEGNDAYVMVWFVVDVSLPIVLGVTGCRLWREASQR